MFVLWLVIAMLGLIAILTLPSFTFILSIFVIALIIPIDNWQQFTNKYLKPDLKKTILIIVSVLTLVSLPFSVMQKLEGWSNSGKNNATLSSPTKPAPTEPSIPATTEASLPTEETYPPETTEPVPTIPTEAATEPSVAETTVPTTEPPVTESTEAPTEPATEQTQPPHTHKWQEATYDAPKTCEDCGATEGESLEVPGKQNYNGHVYTGGDRSVCFHYEPNCAGKYSHEITWDDVERLNLDPCGVCVLK